jgi:hypothetical protein
VDFRDVRFENWRGTELAHARVGPCGQSDSGLWLMILIVSPCQEFRGNIDDHNCHFFPIFKHRSELRVAKVNVILQNGQRNEVDLKGF